MSLNAQIRYPHDLSSRGHAGAAAARESVPAGRGGRTYPRFRSSLAPRREALGNLDCTPALDLPIRSLRGSGIARPEMSNSRAHAAAANSALSGFVNDRASKPQHNDKNTSVVA